MPIRERGNGWQVDVKRKGKRLRRQVYGSKEDAERAEAEMRVLLYGPTPVAQGDKEPTLQDALNASRPRWTGSKNERMALANGQAVVSLLGPDRPVREVRAAVIQALIKTMQDAETQSSTINRKLSALSVILRTAEEHEWIDRAPRVPRLREPDHRVVFFTREEERTILNAMTCDMSRKLVVFLVDTGARLGEAYALQWRDVTGFECATFRATKNGSTRTVPLTARVAEVLMSLPATGSGPFTGVKDHLFRVQWDKARKALGRENDRDCVIHALRHTFCSRLIQLGVDLAAVKDLAGHRNIATTTRYAHLDTTARRAAIAVLG